MTHQPVSKFNPEWNRQFQAYEGDDDDFEPDVPMYIEVDLADLTVKKRWKIVHHGIHDPDDEARSWWHQDGDVTIYDTGDEGYYLECRVKDVPFFSIRSAIDQWGTWYIVKSGAPGDGPVRVSNLGNVIYAQEWGQPSFLRALGTALIEFSDMNEARTGTYDRKYVVEVEA